MMPLVSIIIPCYNAEKWVAECIQSCLNQTHKNIEIIFVDDGSSDNSVGVVKSFQSPKIKIIEQKKQGACAARDCGLAAAQGEWIQYLDADDFLSLNKIEDQLKVLGTRKDLVAVCVTAHFWDGEFKSDEKVDVPEYLSDSDSPVKFLARFWGGDDQVQGGFIWTSAWLASRELLIQAGPWNFEASPDDDGEYFCRVLLQSSGVRLAPLAVNYHRRRQDRGNLSADSTAESYESRLKAVLLKEKVFLKHDQSFYARRALAREFARIAMTANKKNQAVVQKVIHKIKALGISSKEAPVFAGSGRVSRKIEEMAGSQAALQYLNFKLSLKSLLKK